MRVCSVWLTLRHGAGADVGCHAAAGCVGGVVAGVDFDLVAGEVAQVGDDRGLLGWYGDHRLGALEGFLIFGDDGARQPAGSSGGERARLVGHAHRRASFS